MCHRPNVCSPMYEVNEAAIEHLLAADLVVRATVQWGPRDATDRHVRLALPVANSLGEPLRLHMHVPVRIPWKYSLALIWRNSPIRRLDVRGSHVNQCDGSGERWTRQTHKHRWRDAYRDSWAYSPNDIPDTSGLDVDSNEYRQVFEAFCRECGVRVETNWEDPDFKGPFQDTMGSTP